MIPTLICRLILLAALVAIASPADAVPKVRSIADCRTYAQLAMVTIALQKHQVDAQKREAVTRELFAYLDDEGAFVGRAVIIAALAAASAGRSPRAFGREFERTCREQDGDINSLIGEPT